MFTLEPTLPGASPLLTTASTIYALLTTHRQFENLSDSSFHRIQHVAHMAQNSGFEGRIPMPNTQPGSVSQAHRLTPSIFHFHLNGATSQETINAALAAATATISGISGKTYQGTKAPPFQASGERPSSPHQSHENAVNEHQQHNAPIQGRHC